MYRFLCKQENIHSPQAKFLTWFQPLSYWKKSFVELLSHNATPHKRPGTLTAIYIFHRSYTNIAGTPTIVALARCQLWSCDFHEDLTNHEQTKTALLQRLKRDNNYHHLPPLAFTAIGPDPCKNIKMFPWPPVIKPKLWEEDEDQYLEPDSQEDEFYRPHPDDVTSTMQNPMQHQQEISSLRHRPSPRENPSPLPRPSTDKPSSLFNIDEDLDIDLVLSQYQAPCPDPPPEPVRLTTVIPDEPPDLDDWPQPDLDPLLEDLNMSPSYEPIQKH